MDNQSDKDFKSIQAKLVRTVTLNAKGAQYVDKDVLAKNSFPGGGH